MIFLYVFAVIPFPIGQPEKPLLQNRIFLVPQRQSETNMLVPIANSADPVFAPAIRPRVRVIEGQIIPGVPIRAIVLANRPPLPLGKIRPPALPVNFTSLARLQPLLFSSNVAIFC